MKRLRIIIVAVLIGMFLQTSIVFAVKQFQVDTGGTLTTGLLSYYKSDESSGTNLADFWAGNDGTANNSRIFGTAGIVNNGLDFSKGDDFITTPSFSEETSGSIAFWMKFADPNSDFAVSQLNSVEVNGNSSMISLSGGGTIFGVWPYDTTGGQGLIHISTGDTDALLDNTWNQLVITWTSSAGSTKIYVDGVSKGITQLNGFTSSPRINGIVNFGRRRDNSNFYAGLMDEIGLWSKELTSTEITDLYNGGNGQTMVDITNNIGGIRMGFSF